MKSNKEKKYHDDHIIHIFCICDIPSHSDPTPPTHTTLVIDLKNQEYIHICNCLEEKLTKIFNVLDGENIL